MDRIVDTTSAAAAGTATAVTTAITTNLEFTQILFVGALGAVAYLLKRCDFGYLMRHKIATIKTIPARLLTPITVTALVYYLGTDGFNQHVADVGNPAWTMAGLLAALNYEEVVGWMGRMLNATVDKFKEWKQ